MAVLPNVPPILDQDRYIFLSAVSTVTTVPVTFPVFGDGSDLIIEVNNIALPQSAYTFTSPSGPLTQLPLPITDGVVTFTPPIPVGTIAIIGAWHARQIIQPSAPGISRREFNQSISTLIASAREVERALRTALDFVQTDNLGNGFYNAEGELISNVADPQSAKDAVNLETLTTALGELVATGGTTLPVQWTLAGDGVTTAFHITGANIPTPLAYYVSVNGLLLNPSTDYAINPATNFITFTQAPVNGGLICVRMLGYARGVGNISTTAQAIAGTDDTTYMSPLKVAQASVATIANFLASNPALTGIPTAPTAAFGTNTNQIATCAFAIAAAPVVPPQGQLTLVSGTPIMTGNVAAAASLIFTPSGPGSMCPVWNGSRFIMMPFTEFAQLLSDATLSPAAAVAASVYDVFAWLHAGSVVFTRGPVWTNATTRSAAGAVSRVAGALVNTLAITNGPGAGAGLLVGTVATDAGGATVSWSRGGSASGGVPATLNVWNMFNRKSIAGVVTDSGASYQSLTSSYRQARSSANNQINFVCGSAEEIISASYDAIFQLNTATTGNVNIGLDSTTVGAMPPGQVEFNITTGTMQNSTRSSGIVPPQIGSHFLAALELANTGAPFANLLSLNTLSATFRM